MGGGALKLPRATHFLMRCNFNLQLVLRQSARFEDPKEFCSQAFLLLKNSLLQSRMNLAVN